MDDVIAGARAEWYKFRRRPLPWILLAIMLGFLVLANASFLLLGAPAPDTILAAAAAELRQLVMPPNSLYITLSSVNQVGGLLAIVLGAALVGSEYDRGTLRLLLARQPRRAVYLAGALLTLARALLFGLLLSAAAGLLLSLIITPLAELTVDWSALIAALTTPAYYAALLRSYVTLLVYGLLGVAATTLLRSLGAGVGMALGYYVLDTLLITSTLSLLGTQLEQLPGIGLLVRLGTAVLLGYNLNRFNSASGSQLQLTGAAAGSVEDVGIPLAVIGLILAYGLLFAAIPFLVLPRRDLGSSR